jgi:hypothetical protein
LLNNNYFAEKKFPEIEEKVLRAVREGKGLARHIPAFIASRGKDENGIEWVKMPIPHMRETMARMYKGLLYKFYGIRNFDGYHFFQCCMNPAARDHLLSENPPHLIRRFERGDGVFRADILSDPDVPYLIAIWIQFYTGTVYYGLYSLVSLPDGAPLEGS